MDKYEKLEGKKIRCFRPENIEYNGIVVGCDPDIGISIVSTDDKDKFIICLPGRSSTVKKLYHKMTTNQYKSIFNETVEYIEEGEINLDKFDSYWGSVLNKEKVMGGRPNAKSCPFGQ